MNQFLNKEQYHPKRFTEADPSDPPLHVTLDTTEQVATNAAGSVIVTEQEAVTVSVRNIIYGRNLQSRPVNLFRYKEQYHPKHTEADPFDPPLQSNVRNN